MNSLKMNAGGTGFQIARGTVGAGGPTGLTTISFPFTFTNIPAVTANMIYGSALTYVVVIVSITTTGFTCYRMYSGTGVGNDSFTWIAIG